MVKDARSRAAQRRPGAHARFGSSLTTPEPLAPSNKPFGEATARTKGLPKPLRCFSADALSGDAPPVYSSPPSGIAGAPRSRFRVERISEIVTARVASAARPYSAAPPRQAMRMASSLRQNSS